MKAQTLDNIALDNIVFFGAVFFALISGFAVGVYYGIEGDFNILNINTYSPSSSNLTCSNITDLFEASDCLNNKLSKFYQYNLSNAGKELSLEALKEQGGVCTHYSQWYSDRAGQLGFFTKKVSIQVNESFNHQFAVVSNNQGYCILDQTTVRCVELDVPLFERMRLELK